MDTASIVALIGAITAFVTAVAGLVAVIRHANGPQHATPQDPATPKQP